MRKLIAILLVVFAPSSWGAIAFVNCVAADTNGAAAGSKQTGTISVTAGNGVYIIAGFDANCGSITLTMTDVSGDTFNAIGGLQSDAGFASCTGQWRVKSAIGNASEQFTVTMSTGTAKISLSVLQFSGQNATDPFDTSATGFGNVSTTVTTGTWSTAQANELMLTGAFSYALSRTWTADSGWTINSSCTSPNAESTIQYQNVTSTQSSISTTMTISGAGTYLHAMAATMKEAASADVVSTRRPIIF